VRLTSAIPCRSGHGPRQRDANRTDYGSDHSILSDARFVFVACQTVLRPGCDTWR
jgi:hypothetical protein